MIKTLGLNSWYLAVGKNVLKTLNIPSTPDTRPGPARQPWDESVTVSDRETLCIDTGQQPGPAWLLGRTSQYLHKIIIGSSSHFISLRGVSFKTSRILFEAGGDCMRWDEPSGLTTSSRAIWQMRDIFKMCTANRLTVLYQITNLFLQYWYSQHCHHDKHISGISDSGPTGPDKAMEGEMFPSADLSDLRPAPQRIPPSLSCEMSGHSRIILECPPPTSAITRVRTNSSPPVKPFLNISDYNWPFKNALSLWKLKIWIWGKYDKFLS